MKNQELRRLNFRELLSYPDTLVPKHKFDKGEVKCDGFCTECERANILGNTGGRLTLMSHGCDTSDFESVIGHPVPFQKPAVDLPVMFLLEDPGGDYGLGEDVQCGGVTKKPPVNEYYFTPRDKRWPVAFGEVGDHFYGNYFAYLMCKHGLSNVYITNAIKCKLEGDKNKWPVARNCADRFLKREVEAFSPELVFCFGGKAFDVFRAMLPALQTKSVKLYHPSFIQNRAQTIRMTRESAADRNDSWISAAMTRLQPC